MTDLKKYPTPSATFLIPTNTAGESIAIEELEYEARMDEAESFYNWMQQEFELQLLNDQNNYPRSA